MDISKIKRLVHQQSKPFYLKQITVPKKKKKQKLRLTIEPNQSLKDIAQTKDG